MFDWQTDDDEWEEQTAVSPNKPALRKRVWLIPLLIIAGLSAAGLWAYRQVEQRVEEGVTTIEEDILSSHRVVQTAVSNGDVDLLQQLLSGRDPDWVDAQIKMVEEGTLNGRYPLSLEWQPDGQTIVANEIDPALETAEVQFDQTYATTLPDGKIEMVTLRQTAVYRRGATRWLFSPPDIEFWGEWETLENELLKLTYPARDAEIAEKLFDDLDETLTMWCEDAHCGDNLEQVQLRLEKKAGSLAAFHDPTYIYTQHLPLTLPTPSLIGLPLDDAGYDALFRGYASLLITAVIADADEYVCCQHAPIFEALTNYQLNQLGLHPWLVQPADHLALVEADDPQLIERLFEFWDMDKLTELDEDNERFVETAVDFLVQFSPSQSAFEVQSQIIISDISFRRWLNEFVLVEAELRTDELTLLVAELDREWRLFAHFSQYNQGDEPPPIPLPMQDIQLLCTTTQEDNRQNFLYRYQLDTQIWEEELFKDAFVYMIPLTTDEETLLIEYSAADGEQQTRIGTWNNNMQQRLLQNNEQFRNMSGQMPLSEAYLHTYYNAIIGDSASRQHVLLDLNDCDESGCNEIAIPGMPFWSPSGEQAVFVDAEFISAPYRLADGRIWINGRPSLANPRGLYRGDASGQDVEPIETKQAYSPFWLDEQTYGFVEREVLSYQTIMLASTADDKPVPLLTTDDLLVALPEDAVASQVRIDYIVPHPTNNNQLFIVLQTFDFFGYVLLYDRLSGTVEYRIELGSMRNHVSGFSPNGRFLITTSNKLAQGINGIDHFVTLHDIENNRTQNFLVNPADVGIRLNFDWSVNGEWMAMILDDGLLQLYAPEHDYGIVLEHDFNGCHAIGWID